MLTEYTDHQYVKAWWQILLCFSLPVLFFTVACIQVFWGIPVGNHPLSSLWCIIFGVLSFVFVWMVIKCLKLSVIVNSKGVAYGFNVPMPDLHLLSWAEIDRIELITYSFLGFGYHISRKYGLVYNMHGPHGLQIITKKGSKILLGVQKPTELQACLNLYFNSNEL